MKGWRIVAAAIFIVLSFAAVAFAGPALDTLKENGDSLLEVLRNARLKGPAGKKVKERRIEEAVDRLFDFVELSKRTLGPNWNRFTSDRRREFVGLFRKVSGNIYVDRIIEHSGAPVRFTSEVPLQHDIVEVRSVVAAKGGDVSINFRAVRKKDEWKVYDVVIEGVSLIDSYRGQFRDILANNPPEKLLEMLRAKVEKK